MTGLCHPPGHGAGAAQGQPEGDHQNNIGRIAVNCRKQEYGGTEREHNGPMSAAFDLLDFARHPRRWRQHRPTGRAEAIARSNGRLA
jgi:hypothetical protein